MAEVEEYKSGLPPEDLCPKCGEELELSDLDGNAAEAKGVIRGLLVNDLLPYCPRCGLEPFLLNKRVRVVSATGKFFPDEAMGLVGTITKVGDDDFGCGMVDPYLIIHFENDEGTAGWGDMFFPEEVELCDTGAS